jgi:hypothetical protein
VESYFRNRLNKQKAIHVQQNRISSVPTSDSWEFIRSKHTGDFLKKKGFSDLGQLFLRDPTEVSPSPHLRTETGPVSETACSILLLPIDMQTPCAFY